MADQDEEPPFTPSLTEARMPSVDHMFNQGMLNVVLDRTSGGVVAGAPHARPAVGLFSNLVRLTDKALREYDVARFELIDYLNHRNRTARHGAVRISPYIRAVDHMENVVSALARGISSRERLQNLGFGRAAPKMPAALRLDIVRIRDMVEHADDRLTKQNVRASRQPFTDQEPYTLRLENDFAWIGDWKIDYLDIVDAITYLYIFMPSHTCTYLLSSSAEPRRPGVVTRRA